MESYGSWIPHGETLRGFQSTRQAGGFGFGKGRNQIELGKTGQQGPQRWLCGRESLACLWVGFPSTLPSLPAVCFRFKVPEEGPAG